MNNFLFIIWIIHIVVNSSGEILHYLVNSIFIILRTVWNILILKWWKRKLFLNKKMVLQCCVRGCDTIATNGFHSFPSKKSLAERWITAIKASHLEDRLNSNTLSRSFNKICKKHFLPTDFQLNGKGQMVVKDDSVPSLFLPDDIDVCYL